MSIVDNLISILKKKNISQKELCLALGISKNTISNWKTRGTDLPSRYIIPICEFLKISPERLLTGEEKKTTTFDLNENEIELIEVFDQLTDREQIKIIGRMESWIEEKYDN